MLDDGLGRDIRGLRDYFATGGSYLGICMGAYLAGSSRELLPAAQALPGYRVLLVDQRGHGASTRLPNDLSRDALVGDVVAVLEELVPRQRAVLVGQSMGAHTAFLVAVARPDLVKGLVMLEGHVKGSGDREALIRRRPQTDRIDLDGGSHDAHLDAFDMWIDALSRWLDRQRTDAAHDHGR